MKKTEILVITDRSGSMFNIARDVIGGYNKFIEEQKAVPGEAKVTFAQFDNKYEVVYAGTPLERVPKLDHNTFVPRGTTALNDAIGRTLEEQGKRIAEEKWADLVIVCIITDGMENASTDYTIEKVRQMTKHAEDHGWRFVYLGANQDSFEATKNLGISRGIVQNYVADRDGTAAAYATTSASVADLRSTPSPQS